LEQKGEVMEKTTAQDFEVFIDAVQTWCERLGCTRYRFDFAHVPMVSARARCTPNVQKRTALFEFNTEINDSAIDFDLDPYKIGRHEAIHLWLAELAAFAHNGEAEWLVDRLEEGMVRELEHAFDELED
jgi:reverse gyrase